MRLLIDRCVSRRVGEALRDDGHDVFSLVERELDPPDEEILALAVAERRAVVTEDGDFSDLLFQFGRRSAGVLRLPQIPLLDQIGLARRAIAFRSAELGAGAMVTTRRGRVRVAWPDRP